MSELAGRSGPLAGMTGVFAHEFRHGWDGDLVTENPAVRGRSGPHVLVGSTGEVPVLWQVPSLFFGVLWGGTGHALTFGPRGAEASAGAPTLPSVKSFGSILGAQEDEKQREPARVWIWFVDDLVKDSGAAGETTRSLYSDIAVQLLRTMADAPEHQRRVFVDYTAGSTASTATVHRTCTYDVMLDLGERPRGGGAPDLVYDFWGRSAITGLRSLGEARSVHDSGLEALTGSRELVLDRLRRLRRVPEAEQPPWAERPAVRAFDDAEEFVGAWPSVSLQMPNVGLADDGEVNFLWKSSGTHVDLGFYGDGTFSYFARDCGGVKYAGDEVAAHVGLPAELLAIIKA